MVNKVKLYDYYLSQMDEDDPNRPIIEAQKSKARRVAMKKAKDKINNKREEEEAPKPSKKKKTTKKKKATKKKVTKKVTEEEKDNDSTD